MDWLLLAITLILLTAEWRWRLGALRIFLALAAGWFILAARDLGPATRRALETKDRVTTRWDTSLNPYVSGVFTMEREAEASMADISQPVAVLIWLSVSPLLPPIGRRPLRPGQPERA